MSKKTKPIPAPTSDSKKYWDSCKKNKLVIQRCLQCGNYRFPPGMICRNCMSEKAEWVEISGKGSVYSYTVVFRPVSEAFENDVPYIIALVQLDEGVRMLSNIIQCQTSDVKIGMNVRVVFEDINEEISLPKFRGI